MARVLVVDDEADIRGLVRLSLESDGHDVGEAVDGVDALRALETPQPVPDVIVLDVTMPDMDGWEVLSRLKGSAALAGVPVIMLTALAGDMDRIRGGIDGAVRYVTKPFEPDVLRAEVNAVLEGAEPAMRRRAAQEAMERLAVLERGGPEGAPAPGPRPRLTRLGRTVDTARPPALPPRLRPEQLSLLSPRQAHLLRVVAATPTVRAASDQLQVSRSNVYSSLRRIARRLNVATVQELVTLARRELG